MTDVVSENDGIIGKKSELKETNEVAKTVRIPLWRLRELEYIESNINTIVSDAVNARISADISKKNQRDLIRRSTIGGLT